MEPLKKIYPPAVTQCRSLSYEAMATQLIEWRMMLVYMRGKIERGEDVDLDHYAKFLSGVDSAIDRMETKMICSLTINRIVPN